MKVSIGTRLQRGPYGGGNQFAAALRGYLERRRVDVSFDLQRPDLDVILLTEPRGRLRISAFSSQAVLRYLLLTNRQAIVVHRINDSDALRGTTSTNRRLIRANQVADHTVYTSDWLKRVFLREGLDSACTTIRNGSDRGIFHARGHQRWDGRQPLRVVTHHWSTHPNKGFDIYSRLDRLQTRRPARPAVHLTYIGRLAETMRFRNATHIPPLAPADLGDELRRHHLYLSASLHEAGAHHVNEGACCGLPLLYRDSGCLPEYCHGFGIPFHGDDFEEQLDAMMDSYSSWVDRMAAYPHTADRMGEEYLALFEHLLDRRRAILEQRHASPRTLLAGLLPDLPFARTASRVGLWLMPRTGRRR